MKLSIWQQFSSNNSSNFTIVGVFKSPDMAQRAAGEVRDLLNMISIWNEQHWDEIEAGWANGLWDAPPSAPEQAFATLHGIEWPHPIEWASYGVVNVLDNLILISHAERPDTGGEPFNLVIDKLGGQGLIDSYVYGDQVAEILLTITCSAPDEVTAIRIHDEYLGFTRKIFRDGRQLRLADWSFSEADFPEILDTLAQLGCIDITYTFAQGMLKDVPRTVDDETAFIDILEHADWSDDRAEAARALGEMKSAGAFDPLARALGDGDSSVRYTAANALFSLGDPRAIPLMMAALLKEQDALAKMVMTSALGKFQDPSTIPLLVELLSNDHAWAHAVNALGKMGEPAIKPLEVERSRVERRIQERIDRALEQISKTVEGKSNADNAP